MKRLANISIHIVAILLIDLSMIKRRRTTFSFFLFALIFFFFYCSYYMLHVHIISLFFFIAQRYPIQSILSCSPESLFHTFFFLSFFFLYVLFLYIFIVCISFFLYIHIYTYKYVVKPVNRHERFFAKNRSV